MAINDWMQGDGSDALVGSTPAYNIDDNVTAYIQDPLDLLLKEYQKGCGFDIASNDTISIYPGQIVASNSVGTARRFREMTTNVTVDITTSGVGGLDSGSVAADTIYYVYITAETADTAYSGVFSTSSSFPTGVTYARRIGYVKTNSSSEITTKGSFFATGAIAQIVITEHQGRINYTGGTKIPADNTAPQSSEGHPYVQLATTVIPSRANATFLIEALVHANSPSALGQGQRMFLFKDGGTTIGGMDVYYGYGLGTSGNVERTCPLRIEKKITTTTTTPFEITVNTSDGQTTSHSTGVGGGGSFFTYGDKLNNYIKVTELR